jgi:heme/copper-type cytochrome/quinol oxidase subunit 3
MITGVSSLCNRTRKNKDNARQKGYLMVIYVATELLSFCILMEIYTECK